MNEELRTVTGTPAVSSRTDENQSRMTCTYCNLLLEWCDLLLLLLECTWSAFRATHTHTRYADPAVPAAATRPQPKRRKRHRLFWWLFNTYLFVSKSFVEFSFCFSLRPLLSLSLSSLLSLPLRLLLLLLLVFLFIYYYFALNRIGQQQPTKMQTQ